MLDRQGITVIRSSLTPGPPTTPAAQRRRHHFQFPTAYTILFLLIILMAVLTYIIPAGSYQRAKEGHPIPNTYHPVEQSPQNPIFDTLLTPISEPMAF